MNEAVHFEGVSFRYPDTAKAALDDVTVSIEEGTFALAVGPTGAGKSTFLRAVNGLVPHFTGGTFRGHVTVGTRDTLDFPPRKLADVVAFVPQDPGRVVRARPRGRRTRLRHGEPRHRPRAHAATRRGDARPARHRTAPRTQRPHAERRRTPTRRDRRGAGGGPSDPGARRTHLPARSPSGRTRGGRAPTPRARPGRHRAPRRTPPGTRRGIRRSRVGVRRRSRLRRRARGGDPTTRIGAAGRAVGTARRLGPRAPHRSRRPAHGRHDAAARD